MFWSPHLYKYQLETPLDVMHSSTTPPPTMNFMILIALKWVMCYSQLCVIKCMSNLLNSKTVTVKMCVYTTWLQCHCTNCVPQEDLDACLRHQRYIMFTSTFLALFYVFHFFMSNTAKEHFLCFHYCPELLSCFIVHVWKVSMYTDPTEVWVKARACP